MKEQRPRDCPRPPFSDRNTDFLNSNRRGQARERAEARAAKRKCPQTAEASLTSCEPLLSEQPVGTLWPQFCWEPAGSQRTPVSRAGPKAGPCSYCVTPAHPSATPPIPPQTQLLNPAPSTHPTRRELRVPHCCPRPAGSPLSNPHPRLHTSHACQGGGAEPGLSAGFSQWLRPACSA